MPRLPPAPRLAPLLCVALATPWLAGCARDGAPLSTRTLPSGLRITDLRAGTGAPAADGDWVEVDYDARVVGPASSPAPPAPFDSTRGGAPFTFRIGHSKVLAAFAEGVTGLCEGGQRRLTLPPELGYGALGKGPVPPDATLEYDVELRRRFTRSPSGVDYVELEHGTGAKPAAGQTVVVRCRAWLVETGRSILDAKKGRDGYVFELGHGAAIPALEKVLPEMSVGSTWRLGVPPELGYGKLGHLPILVAGQDLLLEVKLVGIRNSP